MRLGVTLGELLSELRAECGYSQNAAHGINQRDSLVQVIKRTQRRLWSAWDWPHLRVSRDMPLAAGQRVYNCPVDLPYERIDTGEVKFGGRWVTLDYGINEREYSIFDPRQNDRSWPIRKWDIAEDTASTGGNPDNRGMIEVWPMPSDSASTNGTLDGYLRLTGVRFLLPLNSDSDRCDLDGDLLVLYCASEVLMRDHKDDAQAKLQMAQQQFQQLRGNQEKNRTFSFGDGEDRGQPPEIYAHPVPFSVGRGSAPAPAPPLGAPYTLHVGVSGAFTGFRGPAVSPPTNVGSVSPLGVGGALIRHLFDFRGTPETGFILNLEGTLPVNHFSRLEVNGQIFEAALATFNAAPTNTQWTWYARLAGLVDGEIYTVYIQ